MFDELLELWGQAIFAHCTFRCRYLSCGCWVARDAVDQYAFHGDASGRQRSLWPAGVCDHHRYFYVDMLVEGIRNSICDLHGDGESEPVHRLVGICRCRRIPGFRLSGIVFCDGRLARCSSIIADAI